MFGLLVVVGGCFVGFCWGLGVAGLGFRLCCDGVSFGFCVIVWLVAFSGRVIVVL